MLYHYHITEFMIYCIIINSIPYIIDILHVKTKTAKTRALLLASITLIRP